MERFCKPHLPKTRVRKAFVSQLMPDYLISELNDLGVKTYKLGKTPHIKSELAYHPDILLNNFKKGIWMCENDPKYLPSDVPKNLFIESESELTDLYPFDSLFNNFKIGKCFVCGKSADYNLKAWCKYDGVHILYVPQNYAKCCTILLNEDAVITCDQLIGRRLREHGYDVLTLPDTSDILLRGYSSGMLGGCAFKLSEDTLAFTGDINQYKYRNEIVDFCDNYNIDVFSLSSKPLYDYGGILPITELVPKDEEETAIDIGF